MGDLSGQIYDGGTGKLYLRCDRGNPGEVFDSIELLIRQNLIIPANNTVYDNLCIKYCGGHALFSYGNNITVQNCEFGWIGGTIQFYDTDTGNVMQFGNAIESDGPYDYFTVKDCYIYQVFDAGLSNQGGGEYIDNPYVSNNIAYEGNLIEKCASLIEIFYNFEEEEYDPVMKNVLITDNIMLYAGERWDRQHSIGEYCASIQMWICDNPSENYKITNNIFYLSTGYLLATPTALEYLPKLSGNTYVQLPGERVAQWRTEKGYVSYNNDNSIEEVVHNILGDKTAKIIELK